VSLLHTGGSRDRDHMLIGFATSFATSAYHHQSCDFESRSSRGALDTTLHDKVCQLLASGRWFLELVQFFFRNGIMLIKNV
jgi:hypothetical protein